MKEDHRIRRAERAYQTGTISYKTMVALIEEVEEEGRRLAGSSGRPAAVTKPAPRAEPKRSPTSLEAIARKAIASDLAFRKLHSELFSILTGEVR